MEFLVPQQSLDEANKIFKEIINKNSIRITNELGDALYNIEQLYIKNNNSSKTKQLMRRYDSIANIYDLIIIRNMNLIIDEISDSHY